MKINNKTKKKRDECYCDKMKREEKKSVMEQKVKRRGWKAERRGKRRRKRGRV